MMKLLLVIAQALLEAAIAAQPGTHIVRSEALVGK